MNPIFEKNTPSNSLKIVGSSMSAASNLDKILEPGTDPEDIMNNVSSEESEMYDSMASYDWPSENLQDYETMKYLEFEERVDVILNDINSNPDKLKIDEKIKIYEHCLNRKDVDELAVYKWLNFSVDEKKVFDQYCEDWLLEDPALKVAEKTIKDLTSKNSNVSDFYHKHFKQ